MMSTWRKPAGLSAEVRGELNRVMLDPDSSPGAAVRSTAMLMAAAPGVRDAEVAARVGVSGPAISRWRQRLADHGVAGLNSPLRRNLPESVRNGPLVADPRNRIAMILRLQAEVVRRSSARLSEKMRDNLAQSAAFLRQVQTASSQADRAAAVALLKPAARHSAPLRDRTQWGAAASRAAVWATPVKQAALIDAAVYRIVRPVRPDAGSVTPVEFSILATLAHHGPMSARQFAAAEQVARGSVVIRLPRLERLGYLTQSAHPTIRDAFLFTPTLSAHALVSGVSPVGIERFVAGFARLPDAQRRELTAALVQLSGRPAISGAETAAAYRAIAQIYRMMDPSDFSLLTARGASVLVDVAQSTAPVRINQLIGVEMDRSAVHGVVNELDRLKYVEYNVTDDRARLVGATDLGRELAAALADTPHTVTKAPFTAAVAQLRTGERAVLAEGLPKLVELIGN